MDSHTGANALLVKEGRQIDNTGPGLGGRPNEADLIGHARLSAIMTEIGRDKISADRRPPSTYPGRQKDLCPMTNPYRSGCPECGYGRRQHGLVQEVRRHCDRRNHEHGQLSFYRRGSWRHDQRHFGWTEYGPRITVPKHNQEGGTMVIPGYGRIGDEHDVLEYRDMLTIIRDRVQNSIKKGMTLQQIKALKPSVTYEYEPRFNRDPAWTAEMFVEAIYKNLRRCQVNINMALFMPCTFD
jgi:hypothetical protein